MAIITLDEAKTYMQITGITQDALISALIPTAEDMFLIVRGIPFFTFTADTTISSATIDAVSDFNNLRYTSIIEDRETDYRATIDNINQDDSEITVDTVASVTDTDITFTIYPKNSQYATSKIISYMMSKDQGNGLKSESIGSYSYSKQDMKSGLPMDITALIEQYQSVHNVS